MAAARGEKVVALFRNAHMDIYTVFPQRMLLYRDSKKVEVTAPRSHVSTSKAPRDKSGPS